MKKYFHTYYPYKGIKLGYIGRKISKSTQRLLCVDGECKKIKCDYEFKTLQVQTRGR